MLIGFLTGIYIPVGSLPESVQLPVKLFPVAHTASLFRQVFMAVPMTEAFKDALSQTVANFEETLGVVFYFGDNAVKPLYSVLFLIAATVFFYSLAIVKISRKMK